jgi:endonuclease/exonuclease/phosphatase (EEP) superfamily protein YafD
VIVGDFNATPFSAIFRTVEDLSGTQNSGHGLGFFPTWPSFAPLLPLDHLLVSGDISALKKQTGSSIGSDHLPVTTEIAF